MTARYDSLLSYDLEKQWTIHQASQAIQDLRHPVVCKHGDLVNIMELSIVRAVKAGPKVGREDLGSLHESYAFAILEWELIPEAGEVLREKIDQCGSRVVSCSNAVRKIALVLLQEARSEKENTMFFHVPCQEPLTSYRTRPASRRQAIRSVNIGILSSVADLNTCASTSSVHSSSFCQKSELVIAISVTRRVHKPGAAASVGHCRNPNLHRARVAARQQGSSILSTASPCTQLQISHLPLSQTRRRS